MNTHFRINRDPQKPLYSYFEEIENKSIFDKNYLSFFKELGKEVDIKRESILSLHPELRDAYLGEICELGWGSHELSSFVTANYENDFKYFFGYIDVKNKEDVYNYSACHSFILSDDSSSLYDLMLERYDRHHFDKAYNYYGIHIPTNIIKEILSTREHERQYINISGHIKHKILTSEEKTFEFIKRLNNEK